MTHVSNAVRRPLCLLGSFAVIAVVSLATGASHLAAISPVTIARR